MREQCREREYGVVELGEIRFDRGRSGIGSNCEELEEAESQRIHRGGDGRSVAVEHFGRHGMAAVLCGTLDLVKEQRNVNQVDSLKICRNINVVERAHGQVHRGMNCRQQRNVMRHIEDESAHQLCIALLIAVEEEGVGILE